MEFSVIIPSYGQEVRPSLKLCIDAFMLIDDPGIELIVVGNAHCPLSPRVRFVQGPPNRAACRNLGASVAAGTILVFCDDDTIFADVSFAALRKVTTNMPRQGFACGAARYWARLGWNYQSFAKAIQARSFDPLLEECVLARGIKRKTGKRDLQEYSFVGHFGLFYKDYFIHLGGFDENYVGWGAEDMDLMLRAYGDSRQFTSLFNVAKVIHLTHKVDVGTQRNSNYERYFQKERSLGYSFRVNNLFGAYDDADTEALKPIQ